MMPVLFAGLGLKLLVVGHAINPGGNPSIREPILTTIGILSFAAVPLLVLTTLPRAWAALAINAVVTLVALADLWYFRYDGDVLSVADIQGWWQWRVVAASLPALMHATDLLAAIDIAIVGAVLVFWRRSPLFEPPLKGVAIGLVLTGLIAIAPVLALAREDPEAVFEYAYRRTAVVGA